MVRALNWTFGVLLALSIIGFIFVVIYLANDKPHSNPVVSEPFTHYTFYQDLPNGDKVLCVYANDGSYSGGPSCDWSDKILGDK